MFLVMLLVATLAVSTLAAKVKFTNLDDWGEVAGTGTWEDDGGVWIPGPDTENWLRSHKKYKNFILEFDAILQGRTLVLVRSIVEEAPFYFGAGIDMVSTGDIRMRRWEDGGWAPIYEHNSPVLMSFDWGEPLHFKITVKGDIARFEISHEDGEPIIDDEVEVGDFTDAGYIYIRSTSPNNETIIENLTIEEL